MTKAVRDRILKDVNGNISDHLRNHIHLTNCIHLKNHMHKQSPILADRALMRDLVVLQRSRSLRDPSASPPSWQSPSVVEMLLRRGERDGLVDGRRSIGLEHSKEGAGISGNSHQNVVDEIRNHRRAEKEVSSGRSLRNSALRSNDEHLLDGNDRVSGNSESRDKRAKKKKEGYSEERQFKNYSDRLKDVLSESDDAVSSHNHGNRRNVDKIAEDAEANVRSHGNSVIRARRRRFRGTRRNRPSINARDVETQNDMSVASNSFAQAFRKNYEDGEAEEFDDQRVTGVPKNGCGIPFNWSRIHHRGKSFLDMAGRSLSCGLSDPRLKKGGSVSRGRNIPDMDVMSDRSSSSIKSDAEALPLLFEASGSQGSDHAAWQHDYSGELGVFADNLLNQESDSDLASEGRSREKHKFHRHRSNRHQNLTQKYMPRTFRDLVGQNLVVQALSNAVAKRKVGLLYVFYGPHGTGKTSCARMFARALNCQSLEPPKPCGYCNACIAHDMGKSRHIKEVGPVANVDFESIVEVLDNVTTSKLQSQYRVFIFDECDTLSSECWSAILKVIDRAPRRVVFILVCSGLDVLPHIIISRCQKFFFPKLKDADIIYTLQWIATKEDLEIDKDALKLIASRSDGSLRDAEMTLEQLSLLGQKITLCLVQELVGLISDEKLVNLLDLALSADTVNTVKNLRDIMESGIEPLALMSQLATVITDILAGSYDFMKEKPRRKFFRRQALTKEDMEKLRQALKTLSEAEKQLRVSNDKMTWLTAALLQLAPDQQYMLPSSSADTSLNHSPLVLQNAALRERPRKSNAEFPTSQAGSSAKIYHNSVLRGTMNGKVHIAGGSVSQQMYSSSNEQNVQFPVFRKGIEEIWLDVLDEIPHTSVKEFMHREGKLISLSYGAAPTVQLVFSSELTKSKAEKVRSYILQAFESVLKSRVTIEIRSEAVNSGEGQMVVPSSALVNRSEIVEIEASPREHRSTRHKVDKGDMDRQNTGKMVVGKTSSFPDEKRLGDRSQSLSLVKSKVSLAHVIQHAEGCSQHSGWSKRKAVSIAEKLEQENLRLESSSRRLLCWNPPRGTRRKVSRLKIRTKKPHTLLKYVSCGRCLTNRSPR